MDVAETIDERLDDSNDEIVAVMDEHTIENIKALQRDADPATPLAESDRPVHLARCSECGHSVRFRPSATGASFTLVDAGPDATYGVGEHGRPLCPDGHGEMEIADDQLKPASEAFADAQSMLLQADAEARGPVQRDLPGILPTFNYQGCYLELEEKAAEVDRLHEEYLERKEEAADAKKAWEKAAELQTKMALEFRRRRQAKGLDDAPTTAAPVSRALLCTWDQAHPDDACPLCSATIGEQVAIGDVLGAVLLPPEFSGHADQVVEYRTKLDVAETIDALDGLVYDLHPATIAEWTPEDRAAVREWTFGETSWENLPAVLGRPHIAAKADDNDVQACTECGAVLRTWKDGDGSTVWLAAGSRVGTDCQGEQAEPHRYPDTAKPKKARTNSAEPVKKTASKSAKKTASKKSGKGRR